jgi:oligogalacturonide transport system ATP-binding protein
MEHLLDRYPRQLSGGQAQRVAVGRAIVKEPEVFLFDEPLSNLDAKLRAAMRVRLTELHRTLREQGRPATVIYVTHDQTEAMTMGERICVLKEGVIQQVDTPVALYRRPANAFVAGFIGSPEMNILDAELVAAGSGLAVRLAVHTLPLPAARAPKVALNGAVKFGLRPEHIGIAPLEGSVPVPAKLRFAEHMGNEVFVHAEIGNVLLTARVPAPQAEALHASPRGAELALYLQMDAAHLFDSASGASLA